MKSMRRYLTVLFMLCMTFEVFAQNHYTATYIAVSDQLHVEACLADGISSLATGNRQSAQTIRLLNSEGWTFKNNRLSATDKASQCVTYIIELNQAADQRVAHKYGKSWLLNTHAWLWLPKAGQVRLSFLDERGEPLSVSAPWQKEQTYYLLGNTPRTWTSRIAFGDIVIEPRQVGRKTLNIAILNTPSKKRLQQCADWLERAGLAISGVYGRLPQDSVQILIVPIAGQKEAVPWAEVQRNGKPAIHFFVDSYRPITEFMDDWTAPHELSHLLLPRVAYQDRWSSEGLASYYQYIAQVQAGHLTAQKGWLKFTAGLERGRKKSIQSLISTKNTRHIYWGGAAIYLLADMALREHPSQQTLNAVLDTFAKLHLPSDELWSAQRLMSTLDSISGTDIFVRLLSTKATQRAFPISFALQKSLDPTINATVSSIFATND